MEFTKEKLLDIYRNMILIRLFEDGLPQYWEEGLLVGTGHSSAGEEAVAVGACSALDEKDYIISTHRAHGHLLARGADPRLIMAELFTRSGGCTGGKGGTMHISDFDRYILGTNGIVGGGITLAGGVGLALKMKRLKQVCLCFFGDGASSRGVFHEALNLASLRKVNTVFLCCNNQYALSTPIYMESANTDISVRGLSYDMPGIRVDGTDVIAVYEVVKEAVERARKGDGPSLIECVAYRLQGHNVIEIRRPQYQPEGEKEEWNNKKDPIKIFKQRLIEMGYLKDKTAEKIAVDTQKQIDEAYDYAINSPEPSEDTLFQNIYA